MDGKYDGENKSLN